MKWYWLYNALFLIKHFNQIGSLMSGQAFNNFQDSLKNLVEKQFITLKLNFSQPFRKTRRETSMQIPVG